MSGDSKVIVVGGGLAGLSAAHTALERGARVLLLDKNAFLGGNSTKATSGINGALTRTQIRNKIPDSVESFLQDTIASSKVGHTYPLAEVLTEDSAPAIEWLIKAFGLDLSLVSRLGGHSFPRTHRGKERFPGMTITYALMEKLEDIASKSPERARVVVKARATELITKDGETVGVKYTHGGKTYSEYGTVILATGGYAADFEEDSLLKKYRPDLVDLPTTNGPHATGDGIKMAVKIGAELKDIDKVQVHPTGLVHPEEPDNKVKFLAAEALRGVGGLMFDREGNRFVNELGRRDYVSDMMKTHNKGPYFLVLNGKASNEIEWHCKHYCGRKLMKRAANGQELAKIMKVSAEHLAKTFEDYNKVEQTKKDPFGKVFFQNGPWKMDDFFHVAVIVPVRHYCMGGLLVSRDGEVESKTGPMPGLYCAGEIMGGTHGANRLGGSSLLDCVVFGRVAGNSASRYLLDKVLKHGVSSSSSSEAPVSTTGLTKAESELNDFAAPKSKSDKAEAAPAASGASGKKVYTLAEVAKHNTESDCWVVVNGEVLNVTTFLDDHPGGKQAIMLFAGRDATEEFNMLHKPDVVSKYCPECIIGVIEGAKLSSKI